jgi:RND family efflux transporter MFP subunit
MNSRLRNVLIACGIVGGAIVIAVVAVMLRPAPPRAAPPEQTPTVSTIPVVAWTDPLLVIGSGTVRPSAEIDVTPQVGGRVVWVSPDFVSGGRVGAGEPLVRIEQADFQNRVAQARAQVAQDEVAVLQAEEEARIAADEFRRFQARNGTTGAPSPLTLRQPQLEAARAALARARAGLSDAELALARTEITAPFDGLVRNESVDVGGIAAAGQPLGRMYASDLVEVVVPLSDADAALLAGVWDLRAGAADRRLPATVFTELGPSRFAWEAYVDRAEAALDEQTRTIDVVVRVPSPFEPGRPVNARDDAGPPLLVGQFAQVEMEGRSGDYYLIPRPALRVDDEVWVVEDGRVRIVAVDVVQTRNDDVFVRGDLNDGDAVVVSGVTLATEGMRVESSPDSRGGA